MQPLDPILVSAPGKVMLSGEYVVLDGVPALVAATAARARACLLPRGSDRSPSLREGWLEGAALPPEARMARRCAEAALGSLGDAELALDTSPLRSGDRKLGLGSSAAIATATVAAVASTHGLDVANPAVRARLLPIALEGHRAVAPEGSGADVAASCLGGIVRFRRDGDRVLEALRVPLPPTLALALIWTGTPARTSDLVAAVRKLRARDPAAYQRATGPLREAARALADAVERAGAREAIDAAAAHHDAMRRLGEVANVPIVTPALEDAAAAARAVGGSAKPSGAGGGDVALAFLPDETARADLADACRAAGLTLLPLTLGDDGPRRA